MTMKRTSIHLDDKDVRALERIARDETKRTGNRLTAAALIRRLIRKFLHSQKKG